MIVEIIIFAVGFGAFVAFICFLGGEIWKDWDKENYDGAGRGYIQAYQCKNCGAVYPPSKVPYICQYCGRELTRERSLGDWQYTDGLNDRRKETDNCRIVIARRIGKRWEVLPEEAKNGSETT